MSKFAPLQNYPLPSRSSLLAQYRGRQLTEIPVPAIVLDRSKIQRNCNAMLEVCAKLGVGFRAHVKSHKTLELSKMQVGESGPANFIVSTVIEAEHLVEYVKQVQDSGREASILYGVPLAQSHIERLAALAKMLKPESIHVIIDNIDAFKKFRDTMAKSEVRIGVFIKIDTGYHRAGIKTSSPNFPALVEAVAQSTNASSGPFFKGFYSHYGHSYAGNSEEDAAQGLIEELQGLEDAMKAVPPTYTGQLVLSVGATPTATAAQTLFTSTSPLVESFHSILNRLRKSHTVELHAGVYPLLDCQQVATRARAASQPTAPGFAPLNHDAIAIRLIAEVTSVYTEREKPEALVTAGSLALGRDPCKSYPGWGIVTPDLSNSKTSSLYDDSGDKAGWIVGRISQEHGILTWEGDRAKSNEFSIGDRVAIWPNHACVAGAGFGWYVVVDSEGEDGGNRVVDVWVRWRGW